jgi:hypothetical protein
MNRGNISFWTEVAQWRAHRVIRFEKERREHYVINLNRYLLKLQQQTKTAKQRE